MIKKSKKQKPETYTTEPKIVREVAVCESEHAWPIVLTIEQIRRTSDNKHINNLFNPDVPNCPTCGKEWSYVDPSRIPEAVAPEISASV